MHTDAMNEFLKAATEAARQAGNLLREHFGRQLVVNVEEAHDLKLELDERSQEVITRSLQSRFPTHSVLGEEGSTQSSESDYEWVVDPIDGTVNYFYGIPHFCISIALRRRDQLLVGVIYDPMRDELWQATRQSETLLNGVVATVSDRRELKTSVVSVGFSKSGPGIAAGMQTLQTMIQHARKCRMMGSAALDLAYVACGRFDAYLEQSVNWWDIAAGVVLVEQAGGKVQVEPSKVVEGKLTVIASNGKISLPEVA
jgi:myo-inositol-1(or 4)-monophosphatase